MQTAEQKDTENSPSEVENAFEVTVDNSNAIQIRTRKDGHNAGRKYYLQARSAEEFAAILSELKSLTKIAVERAEASSKWSKLQERVRVVYASSWFQGIAAFLIISVLAHITFQIFPVDCDCALPQQCARFCAFFLIIAMRACRC
jgi:hypothetical protein